MLDFPDFVSGFPGWILATPSLIILVRDPWYIITVRILTQGLIYGTRFALFDMGSRPLDIILGLQGDYKTNPIFMLQRAVLRLLVTYTVPH